MFGQKKKDQAAPAKPTSAFIDPNEIDIRRTPTMWLNGDDEGRVHTPTRKSETIPFEQRQAKALYEATHKDTCKKLMKSGRLLGEQFKSGLPKGYAPFHVSVEARTLSRRPELGFARFGQVPLHTPEGETRLAVFYCANFYSEIQAKDTNRFFDLENMTSEYMFFALAWKTDEKGQLIGIADDIGRDGLCFRKRKVEEAYSDMLRIVTGKSSAEWKAITQARERELRRFASLQGTPSPGFTR